MKNRFLRILAALLALALLLGASASAEIISLADKTGSLNLRKGPGTEYESTGYLQHGDRIEVLEQGEVWSKIKTEDGKTGYVKNLYIYGKSESSYANDTVYYAEPFTAYATANVNFRSGAGADTASMGVLAAATELTVIGHNGDFYLVKTAKGTQGFVSKKYISGVKPQLPQSTPVPVQATVCLAYKDGSIHLRKGQGANYKSLGTLRHGDEITVLEYGKLWSRVKTAKGTGYIKNIYIKDYRSEYAAGVKYFDAAFDVYSTGSVNFRAGASSDTPVIGSLPRGTKLRALGENGGYYLVETKDGEQGFMYKKYASRTKPDATPAPTPKPTPVPNAAKALEGLWQSEDGMYMAVGYDENAIMIDICRSGDESARWQMTGRINAANNRITADDCAKFIVSINADGKYEETAEYDGGEAVFTMADGMVFWQNKAEDSAEAVVFEKIEDVQAFFNPNQAETVKVHDIFASEGGQFYIRAGFDSGEKITLLPEAEASGIFTLKLSSGCEIMLPADLTNPLVNYECDLPDIWFRNAAAVIGKAGEAFSFTAEFDMNDAGEITKLVFISSINK